ncbi:BTAD domain-containing putative transcriptional regulator [Lentzea sp. NPDC006480]|uniref:BTAD domain-containing putative transcriptional regulator n=1 Tax=Lentzea sp. NPDC006480 TaxID=3157176 RepID=UPI0033A987F8
MFETIGRQKMNTGTSFSRWDRVTGLSITLLGPVAAFRGNDPVDLGRPRMRAMLSLLAARADQVVSRDELVDGLWGDQAPPSVDSAIYTYVSSLRRALEPGRTSRSDPTVLTSAGSGYALRIEPDHVDVHQFERHLTAAHGAAPSAAIEALNFALSLWQGDPLQGVSGPFADSYRRQLLDLRLTARQKRAEVLLEAGRAAEVVVELGNLVRQHPMREDIRILHITALHRTGRRAEAREAYEEASRYTIEQLGLDPGPNLVSQYERLSTEDDRTACIPRATRRALRFTGRDAELQRLRDAVARVEAGQGGCVWLSGEPGIGKTALLREALSEAPGVKVMSAAGDVLGRRFAFRLVLRCLGVGSTASDTRSAALARRLDSIQAATGDGEDPVPYATNRIVDLVSQLSLDTPLVLVADDVHWADEGSALVLHQLIRLASHLPLLLVCAATALPDDQQSTRLRRAMTRGRGEMIRLGPLPDETAAELINDLTGAARTGPKLRKVITLCGGNPYYLKEFVEELLRENAIGVQDATAELIGTAPVRMPQPLCAAIKRRLGALSSNTVEMLRQAALLGPEFSVRDATLMTGRPAGDLVVAIEEAMASGLLVSTGTELAFQHPVVRQGLCDSMPLAVRDALHREATRAMYRGGEQPEKIARQLVATTATVDPVMIEWLKDTTASLLTTAPELLADLLTKLLTGDALEDEDRELFTTTLARLNFRLGRPTSDTALYVLARTRDTALAAEMREMLAHERGLDSNGSAGQRADKNTDARGIVQ